MYELVFILRVIDTSIILFPLWSISSHLVNNIKNKFNLTPYLYIWLRTQQIDVCAFSCKHCHTRGQQLSTRETRRIRAFYQLETGLISQGTEWKYLLHIDKRRGRISSAIVVHCSSTAALYGLRAAGGPESQGTNIAFAWRVSGAPAETHPRESSFLLQMRLSGFLSAWWRANALKSDWAGCKWSLGGASNTYYLMLVRGEPITASVPKWWYCRSSHTEYWWLRAR